MDKQLNISELLEFTAEIVAAHVGNNKLDQKELPSLIQGVYKALSELNDVTKSTNPPHTCCCH